VIEVVPRSRSWVGNIGGTLADVPRLLESAQTAVTQRRYDDAIALCRTVLTENPKSFDAALIGASAAVRSGDAENVKAFAEQSIVIKPDDATGYVFLGRSFLMRRQPDVAAGCLSKALELDPNQAVVYHLFGQALQQADRDSEAVEAFRRAIQMAPNSVDSHIALGQLHIKLGNRSEAALCFRRAYKIEPHSVRGLSQLAKALIEEDEHQQAEAALRKAILLEPNAPIPLALLGQVLQQNGRFAEAAEVLRRAVKVQPLAARCYLQYAQCLKISGADRDLIDQMLSLTSDPRLSDDELRHLRFALGKAFDDLGDCREAMVHFDAGNRIMLQMAKPPFDRVAHAAEFDLTIKNLSPELFAENRSIGNESDAPVFIVGMIRSGTTLVEQIVSSHPDVAAGGELKFWLENTRNILDNDLSAIDPTRIPAEAEAYLRVLRDISPDRLRVTDKMPTNFIFLGAIHLAFPNARIIHCRRNPLDNCLSLYLTAFPQPVNFLHSRENILFYYSEYQRLMNHWREVIPSDRLLEIDYEALVGDREATSRRMIEFTGLEWNEACLHPEMNPRTVKTPSMWQVRQPVYQSSVGRWRNYEPWLGAFRSLLPK